jgi:hypothetical protein
MRMKNEKIYKKQVHRLYKKNIQAKIKGCLSQGRLNVNREKNLKMTYRAFSGELELFCGTR